MKDVTLRVTGMHCQGCVGSVRAALEGVEGVRRAEVSLEEERATVLAEDGVEPDALAAAVESAGYEAAPAA